MKEIPQGFKNSQKVDIGVISKYARAYLKSYFNRVYSVKGEMTAEYRKIWGLQESFKNDFDRTEYKPKDRSNHAHHCIDAITIACMDKSKYDIQSSPYRQGEFVKYIKVVALAGENIINILDTDRLLSSLRITDSEAD